MALFDECKPSYAQIVLDTADIVRDRDITTVDLYLCYDPSPLVVGPHVHSVLACYLGNRDLFAAIVRF